MTVIDLRSGLSGKGADSSRLLACLPLLLAEGKPFCVPVHGISMQPALKTGDRLRLAPVSPEQLQLGDLMAFRDDGRLIVHRFAGRDAWGRLRQKGDNLRGFSLVSPEDVLARVSAVNGRDMLKGWGLACNRLHGVYAGIYCMGWSLGSSLACACRSLAAGNAAGQAAPRRWRQELRLLDLCACLEMTDAQREEARAILCGGVDWRALQELGTKFNALQLLGHHSSALGVDTPLDEELQRVKSATCMRNLRFYGFLKEVLLACREEGIPVILLKGAHLARWVYGDLGLRPMSDLDLLFRPEDEQRVSALFLRLGGVQAPEPEGVPAILQRIYLKYGHAPFWSFPRVPKVEAHYHLLASHRVDHGAWQDLLWQQALTEDWDGLPVKVLHPEHQLIHLLTHLHAHVSKFQITLCWVADIRLLLRKEAARLDWDRFIGLAERLGLARICMGMLGSLAEGSCPEPWGTLKMPGSANPHRFATVPFPSLEEMLRGNVGSERLGRSSMLRLLGGMTYVRRLWHSGGMAAVATQVATWCFPSRRRLRSLHPGAGPWRITLWQLLDPLHRLIHLFRGAASLALMRSRN